MAVGTGKRAERADLIRGRLEEVLEKTTPRSPNKNSVEQFADFCIGLATRKGWRQWAENAPEERKRVAVHSINKFLKEKDKLPVWWVLMLIDNAIKEWEGIMAIGATAEAEAPAAPTEEKTEKAAAEKNGKSKRRYVPRSERTWKTPREDRADRLRNALREVLQYPEFNPPQEKGKPHSPTRMFGEFALEVGRKRKMDTWDDPKHRRKDASDCVTPEYMAHQAVNRFLYHNMAPRYYVLNLLEVAVKEAKRLHKLTVDEATAKPAEAQTTATETEPRAGTPEISEALSAEPSESETEPRLIEVTEGGIAGIQNRIMLDDLAGILGEESSEPVSLSLRAVSAMLVGGQYIEGREEKVLAMAQEIKELEETVSKLRALVNRERKAYDGQ